MEQPFEEVAAPLEMGAWNDEALLDVTFLCFTDAQAFERAVTTHGIDKKDKKASQYVSFREILHVEQKKLIQRKSQQYIVYL